ncbi:mechanosensitive ion channel family protein [Glycomyces sp. TRM65418]|uniref:mechanosensitive ion channel family protein n=1 Tax=Glycomyces sp. TRM65418 TaxID=2867006 RepID=UPI001CE6B48B|nr:mechanosensitive ion channel family protein [Glycomyces sp. TRM65418]MCC3762160.1 mechanosensitive ion channel family protein [Glycomyces sp. TRM65418]QZD56224.1 mechanosensitive ion channel family protein [Glycomyces sp. TRM65418]
MALLAASGGASPCESGFNSCSLLWKITESEGFAETGGTILDKIGQILLILLAAWVLRWIVNRSIARIIKQVTSVKGPQGIAELAERLASSANRRGEIVGDRSQKRAETLTGVLQHVAGIVIWTVAFMLVLSAFNVNLAPILASAGIAGIAIGFGAQNLVQDYLAGIFILLEDQYGVGDVVDVGDASGSVVDMGLRVTTLRSLDGTLWYVRNGQILRVGNSSQSWAYVLIDTPLPPSADIDRAGEIITEVAEGFVQDDEWREHILEAPEYLGPVEVTIDVIKVRLGVRTTSDQQWAAGRELRLRVTEALREAGIIDPAGTGRIYVPRSVASGGAAGADGTGA